MAIKNANPAAFSSIASSTCSNQGTKERKQLHDYLKDFSELRRVLVFVTLTSKKED
ncbi:491_t:CDS:2 [Gigaspora margarita]|uniref:491_t:CDS:1 n=1 Tax=Gigaspora margarita TaxID=4874 RepID=A0ABN7UN13_GIGMA|nr:491_t:CDS:2 [Gigaspora margarita]